MHSFLLIDVLLQNPCCLLSVCSRGRILANRASMCREAAESISYPVYHAPQISSRYSRMVRSLEKNPEFAVLWSAMRFHASVSP